MTAVEMWRPPRGGRRWRQVWAAAAGLLLGGACGLVCGAVAMQLPSPVGPGFLAFVPVAVVGLVTAWRDSRTGVALFALALPAGLIPVTGSVELVQILAPSTVLLVAAARLRRRCRPLVLSWPVRVLLAMVLWSLLTMPVAPDLQRALRWNAALLAAVLLAAAVETAAEASWPRLRQLTWAVFAGSAVTCAVALPESTTEGSFGGAVVEGRAQGVFSQPNELGLFAGTTVILALALLVSAQDRRSKPVEQLVVALGGSVALVVLALSLSRGAWLGTLLAVLACLVLVPMARRVVLVSVGIALVGGVLLASGGGGTGQLDVIGARIAVIADREANPHDDRPAIWGEGIRQLQENPWTGGGAGNFTETAVRSGLPVVASVRPSHAHNVLLNFTAEGGLVAGALLVVAGGMTAAGVVRGRRYPRWKVAERGFLTAVGCAPLVLVGHGMVDVPLRNPTVLLQSFAVLGLAVAVGSVRPCVPSVPPVASPGVGPTGSARRDGHGAASSDSATIRLSR